MTPGDRGPVLFIDGPAKGHVIVIFGKPFCWNVVERAEGDMHIEPSTLLGMRVATYYFHKFIIVRSVIRVASMFLNPDDIDPQDLLECILSREARLAADVPERGGVGGV